MAEFAVVSALVCDEIRREITGKDIIIGVYTGEIILGANSTSTFEVIPLTLWIELNIRDAGEHNLDYQIKHNNDLIFSLNGIKSKTPRQNTIVSMPLGPVPVSVSGPGVLCFQLRMDGRKWRTVREKDVKFGSESLAKNHPLRAMRDSSDPNLA